MKTEKFKVSWFSICNEASRKFPCHSIQKFSPQAQFTFKIIDWFKLAFLIFFLWKKHKKSLETSRGKNNKIVQFKVLPKKTNERGLSERCSIRQLFKIILFLSCKNCNFPIWWKTAEKQLFKGWKVSRERKKISTLNFPHFFDFSLFNKFQKFAVETLTVRPQVACMTAMSCICALFLFREGFFH